MKDTDFEITNEQTLAKMADGAESARQEEYSLDYLEVIQDNRTGLFHGAYFRNKPRPSGCDIFILDRTTALGYKTENEAALAIEKCYPNMEKISTIINRPPTQKND